MTLQLSSAALPSDVEDFESDVTDENDDEAPLYEDDGTDDENEADETDDRAELTNEDDSVSGMYCCKPM